ncbi:MAG TPA: hypothetical protein PKK26_11025, partial [Candidatus Wallbacteria bacterium]|nr:hypothetical protein [Candidatus Wallbacteria bacterium]
MMNRKLIKLNSIITLVAFVLSVFAANISMMVTPASAETAASVTEGTWNVKTPKGEFQAKGTGGYETWADGQQKFVVRDTLGHLLSWGEAKIENATGGAVKVTVKDPEGLFEAVKVAAEPITSKVEAAVTSVTSKAPAATTATAAPAVMESQSAAPAVENNSTATVMDSQAAAAPVAVKTTLGQKLSALKTKVTTPIEGGGKGSTAWDNGYKVGSEGPANLVNKVKSIFHKDTTASTSATTSTTSAPAASSSTSSSTQTSPASGTGTTSTAAPVAAKTTIGEKLSALKTKVTTPIEGGG